jgi:hypothetical protein
MPDHQRRSPMNIPTMIPVLIAVRFADLCACPWRKPGPGWHQNGWYDPLEQPNPVNRWFLDRRLDASVAAQTTDCNLAG